MIIHNDTYATMVLGVTGKRKKGGGTHPAPPDCAAKFYLWTCG